MKPSRSIPLRLYRLISPSGDVVQFAAPVKREAGANGERITAPILTESHRAAIVRGALLYEVQRSYDGERYTDNLVAVERNAK